jgi:endonuclease/exonuclease/phosphatase family metal-dependent hydrolase
VRLRVVVYNVRGFRDDFRALVSSVRHAEPDLVLLNESGPRRKLRRFARSLGMEAAADPFSPFRRRVKDAVLVRPPWRIVSRRLHRFERPERFYPRGALIAQIGNLGVRISAVAVHLGGHPGDRFRHARELTDLVPSLAKLVVVGGDLNDTPDGRCAGWIGERLWDAWLLGGDVNGETFPATDPTARIDYLFVSESLRVERVMVPRSDRLRATSDHLPVIAELTIEER